MSNAKEIKERIASVKETRKITNAMYLISSSKMRQAKEQLSNTEPFFFAMQREIRRVIGHFDDIENKFFDLRKNIPVDQKKIGIIVITADKGLAGSYNHNVIKETEKLISKPGIDTLFVLGEVGKHYFARREGKLHLDTTFKYTVQDPTLHKARGISRRVTQMYLSGELDEVHIIYTKMINTLSQTTEHIQLLPLLKDNFDNVEEKDSTVKSDFYQCGELFCNTTEKDNQEHFHNDCLTFYPSPEAVINSITPSYLNGILYGCLVEAFCCEHSARMIAMQNATDSADKMLQELTMTYNRVRQSDITQELTEVVAGANAQQRK